MFAWVNSLKGSLLKNKILVENFAFLSVLQVSNLILFIITIPYLFRVLGSHNYGLIVFAQTVAFYFSILINFGFNLTATRDISVHRDDKEKISEIFSAVITLKSVLFFVSLILMVILIMVVPSFLDHKELFLLSLIPSLGEALYPIWFFQGLEKMKYITYINVFTRIVATVLIFIVINDISDYSLYPLIIGGGMISGSFLALYIVALRYRITFRFLPFYMLAKYFRGNILYFGSNVSTQIYLNANRLVAGVLLGMREVAFYDIADKVVNIAKVPLSILAQVLFPRYARLKSSGFIRKMLVYTMIFVSLLVTGIYLFSGEIIQLLSGSADESLIRLLRILALSIIPIAAGLYFGDIILINYDMKLQYAKLRMIGFLVYLFSLMLLILTSLLTLISIASLIVCVETFMTLYSYSIVRKYRLVNF